MKTKRRGFAEKHVAIDSDGNPLAYTSAQVKDIVRRAFTNGELVLAVVEVEGLLACHVFGPPSEKTADMLDQLASSYRKGITQAEHRGE